MRAHPRFLYVGHRSGLLLAVVTVLLLFSMLHSSPEPVLASDPNYSVTIVDYAFQPLHINITTGTTVTWTYSSGSTIHTVTSDPGTNQTQSGNPLISSGDLNPGQSFGYTFNLPGYYPYQCAVHPTIASMNGWVMVTGSPVNPPMGPSNNSSFPWLIVSGIAVAAAVLILVAWLSLKRRRVATP